MKRRTVLHELVAAAVAAAAPVAILNVVGVATANAQSAPTRRAGRGTVHRPMHSLRPVRCGVPESLYPLFRQQQRC
jgi:hypothetical protein